MSQFVPSADGGPNVFGAILGRGVRPRVAILEARMSTELTALLERHGADPYPVPAVVESRLDGRAEVDQLIDGLGASWIDVVVFLTGAGARALFADAEAAGRADALIAGLNRATIVCRGPKPVAVLKRLAVPPTLIAPEPHTTRELLEVMAELPLEGVRVAIVHHGEQNVALARALAKRGALLTELLLYQWLMPGDVRPLARLVEEIVAGRVEAVAFTSQIQARHLFAVAHLVDRSVELREALHGPTLVGSVGPTCSAVLRELGVEPDVEPAHPKMGHLVGALVERLGRPARQR